jgi:arginyl-tRNA synthetase
VLPYRLIEQRLQPAVLAVIPEADPATIQVRPCADTRFGDYQSAALMSLAKARKLNPRALAEQVVAKLDVSDLCERVEIAGAGFLNFRLLPVTLTAALDSAVRGEHLFFSRAAQPRPIVIDFSSPNVAKPMHVGHIRSTILGDCLARLFRLLGHRVVTDNHIGDWGTQFGMLLVGWKRELNPAALEADAITEMERIYKLIQAEIKRQTADWLRKNFPDYAARLADGLAKGMDEDEVNKKLVATLPAAEAANVSPTGAASRQELVQLQAGDAENLAIWHRMIALSQHQFDTIYGRLGVKFDFTLGESFYNPHLKAVVADLTARGIARESEGAIVVFFDDNPALKAHPALVQKSDGAANYATTDLATLTHRLETWQPEEIIYVTDGRQQLHFQQIFAAFRNWQSAIGNRRSPAKLAHVWFGSILGEDNKPFKTRSGETVKLADLLDEAEERALKVVTEKNPALPEADRKEIARVIGLGAVKYADLLPNRQSDYVFSWDKMLAFSGNTAPYLQYAYTRIRSIFRKSDVGQASRLSPSETTGKPATGAAPVLLAAPEEIALAKQLLNFGLVLEAMAEEYRPNYLCNYLYDLASHFMRFFETCPVLKAEEPSRSSRLALCDLTARVLKQGLKILGIETVEQM